MDDCLMRIHNKWISTSKNKFKLTAAFPNDSLIYNKKVIIQLTVQYLSARPIWKSSGHLSKYISVLYSQLYNNLYLWNEFMECYLECLRWALKRFKNSFIKVNYKMTTSVRFFLSRDFSVHTIPPLDTISTGNSHVAAQVV